MHCVKKSLLMRLRSDGTMLALHPCGPGFDSSFIPKGFFSLVEGVKKDNGTRSDDCSVLHFKLCLVLASVSESRARARTLVKKVSLLF